jgi:hypothetical protein
MSNKKKLKKALLQLCALDSAPFAAECLLTDLQKQVESLVQQTAFSSRTLSRQELYQLRHQMSMLKRGNVFMLQTQIPRHAVKSCRFEAQNTTSSDYLMTQSRRQTDSIWDRPTDRQRVNWLQQQAAQAWLHVIHRSSVSRRVMSALIIRGT